ncbi:MAG: hypothetical protein ACNA71_03595 [Kiritimatiellia bacterium]
MNRCFRVMRIACIISFMGIICTVEQVVGEISSVTSESPNAFMSIEALLTLYDQQASSIIPILTPDHTGRSKQFVDVGKVVFDDLSSTFPADFLAKLSAKGVVDEHYQIADGQPTVYLRWVMGPTGSNIPTERGWNIDDVEIWQSSPPPSPAVHSEPVWAF